MKVLLFADPGIDDTLAIIYALLNPAIDLLGIVTGYGNVSVEDATRNSAYLLDLANRSDIPVIVGASKPVTTDVEVFYPEIHGPQGLGPIVPPEELFASIYPFEKLFEIVERNIEDLIIVDVGRQTSLAIAFILRPDLMRKVKEVHLMGGAFQVPGNVTSMAEANFWGDPASTNEILRNGQKIYITPLNVTNRAIITRRIAEYIYLYSQSAYKKLIPAVTDYYSAFYDKVMPGVDGSPVHDVFTLYYLTNKSRTHTVHRDVYITESILNRGLSVADLRYVHETPKYQHFIVLDFDYQHFIKDFIQTMLASGEYQ
ncbi:MAG: nucleoside hydrolase [Bacillota bacterium]